MDTMNEIEKVPQVVQSTVYNALSGTKSMKVETLLYICEGAQVTIDKFPIRDLSEVSDRQISVLKWEKIVARLYSQMYLHEWKKRYDDPYVLDGEQWSLEIGLTGRRKRTYCGSNAYPPYWKELLKIFRAYTMV